jgi:hypothetical protein
LLDANGRTLATRPVQEPAVQDVDVHTWKLEFWGYGDDGEKVGPPVRMTVELPVAMQAVEVPFAFRDLPIP